MQGEEEEHGGKEGQTMGKKNRHGRRRHQGERGIEEGRIRATGILGYREERGEGCLHPQGGTPIRAVMLAQSTERNAG